MDLAYELHDLVRTLDRQADDVLSTRGLGYNRYVALLIVDEHPGISGRQLSGALGVSDAATSGILRKLEAAGLVRDVAEAGSGRLRRWEVTDAGHRTRTECETLLGDRLGDVARTVGVDPDVLAATVRTLHDRLRADPAKESTELPEGTTE